MKSRCHLGEVL